MEVNVSKSAKLIGVSNGAVVTMSSGSDTVFWDGSSGYASVDGSSGTDTLVLIQSVTGDFSSSTVFKNFEALIGSSAADNITADTLLKSIDLKAGSDTFIWNGKNGFTKVDGSSGSDTLQFKNAATLDFTKNGAFFKNFENIVGSTGADNVTGKAGFKTIDLGAGADTVIWNGETTFTSISGGTGADIDTLLLGKSGNVDLTKYTAFTSFETLQGGVQANNVTASTNFSSINLGAGNDTFKWSGDTGYSLVDGSSGTDTLVFTRSVTADFTHGSATLFKNFEALTGSSSADNITTSTTMKFIDLSIGNDTFTWDGKNGYSKVDGGKDTDTLKFSQAATLDSLKNGIFFKNFEGIVGSTGADNVTGKAGFKTIELGAGNDTFTWNGETIFTSVSGGTGADIDTLLLGRSGKIDLTKYTAFKSFETLLGSAAANNVTANTDFASIDLGAGNDTFNWGGSTSYSLVNGSSGTDILAFTRSITADFVNGSATLFKNFEALTGSSGADDITTSTTMQTIDLGAGNDTFTWDGKNGYSKVDGGKDTDTLKFASAATMDFLKKGAFFKNFEVLVGSTDGDIVTGKAGFKTIDLGAGADTFTWNGETAFSSVNGGTGSDVDTLVLGTASKFDLTKYTAFKSFEMLQGSAAANNVTASTDFSRIDLGAGNDTFSWDGYTSYSLVDGSSGTDMLAFTRSTTADFTHGSATLFKSFEALTGSSSADDITTSTTMKTIDLGAGNDTFTWDGKNGYTKLDGGKDTDTLQFAGAATLDLLKNGAFFKNFEVIVGSTEADNVTGKAGFKTIDLGLGADTFIWNGETVFTSINGGTGSDIDTLVIGTATKVDLTKYTAFKSFETLLGSAAANNVTANTDFATIDLGAGNDTFNWDSYTDYTLVDGGTGTDTLVLASAAIADFLGSGTMFKNFEALIGSTNADSITTSIAMKTIDLSAGNDTFVWDGNNGYSKVDGGKDTDTLLFSSAATLDLVKNGAFFANFEVIVGSTEADNVTGKAGFKTVDLGAGTDTFIWNGENTFSSVSGGTGADSDTLVLGKGGAANLLTYTAFSSFEALRGSAVADNVTAGTIYTTVDLQAGNDTFSWDGKLGYTSVDGSSGADTLILTSGATLDFTSGATAFKNFEAFVGAAGADDITATQGSFNTVNLAAGDDTFNWNGTAALGKIDGGAGTDTLKLSGAATLDLTGTAFSNFEKLVGSTLADNIVGNNTFTSIDLQAGNDTFTWSGYSYTSLNGGAGTDTLVLSKATSIDFSTTFSGFEVLEGSAGADAVTDHNNNFTNIDLKAGNDTFTWNGVNKVNANGGADIDTLKLSQGGSFSFAAGSTNYFFAGFEILEGSDAADELVSATSSAVDLNDGNDTFVWDGTAVFTSVDGGAGTDILQLSKGTTFNYNTAFKSFETLLGSTDADTINVNSKSSIIDYNLTNSGADEVVFDTAYWGANAALDIRLSYALAADNKLDFSTMTITAASGVNFSFNLDGSSNAAYTGTFNATGGNLTIDFGSSNLGTITLDGGAVNWYNSRNVINDKAGHTMFWTGSILNYK